MLLYIHIPFVTVNVFTAFNSYTDRFHLKQEYMKALKTQLRDNINNYVTDGKNWNCFIGGGTPSTIKAIEYKELFEIIAIFRKRCGNYNWSKSKFCLYEWLETMKSFE